MEGEEEEGNDDDEEELLLLLLLVAAEARGERKKITFELFKFKPESTFFSLPPPSLPLSLSLCVCVCLILCLSLFMSSSSRSPRPVDKSPQGPEPGLDLGPGVAQMTLI